VSFVCFLAYSAVYLVLEGAPWTPPIPIYVEQCLLPLYLAAGVVGYWGAVRRAAQIGLPVAVTRALQPICTFLLHLLHSFLRSVRSFALAIVQHIRIAAIRYRRLRFARSLLPLSRFLDSYAAAGPSRSGCERVPRIRFLPIVLAVVVLAMIPAFLVNFATRNSAEYANKWNEPWPSEPELIQFFKDNIGRTVNQPIRGSVAFWHFIPDTAFTMTSLWANGIHTVDEYSQLVTPQALYVLHALLQNNLTFVLNEFVPLPSPSWYTFFGTLQLFGVRFYVAEPEGAKRAEEAGYRAITLPRRPVIGQPGTWRIFELPRPNVGNYSPTEVVTAGSAPEMAMAMGAESFDFARQAVLSAAPPEKLVPARDMRISLIHGGFHLSGRSDGTSLVVVPLQFSNCLRARDQRVELVRSDLLMTGVIFSGEVDTDIMFDYGIFAPWCRRADLADMRRLQIKIDVRAPHLAGDRQVPHWKSMIGRFRDVVSAIK
jgi:hypothetical protein